MSDDSSPQSLSIEGSGTGNALMALLCAKDIEPGDSPSYETCKTLYLYHPIGAKLAEAPVALAQSKPREIAVKNAPEEVRLEFTAEWERMGADGLIFNEHRTARMYGIASIVALVADTPANVPVNMSKIWDQELTFNVLDPLNTAGSLVLSQIPTDKDFQKPVTVSSAGEVFHRTRFHVAMNELPVYLAYTGSAFGFVGRSVYQRILYPLKSFIQTMIADDVIANKNTILVAHQESPGSIVSEVMARMMGVKRRLLRYGRNGNVISVGLNEKIETLDMQNVDGSGRFARDNILKNIATGADMPASIVNNETLVSGFGEGAEDAKNIARYGEGFRLRMQSSYRFLDNFCMYRAWSPPFYERIRKQYPSTYGSMEYAEAFSLWRRNYSAEWPSLLMEPESEKIDLERTKLESIISFLQTLTGVVDPDNLVLLMQWATDNISENKLLFPHPLDFDWELLAQYVRENHDQQQAMQHSLDEASPLVKKLSRFS